MKYQVAHVYNTIQDSKEYLFYYNSQTTETDLYKGYNLISLS